MVESNYFGKGNTTSYDRAIYHNVGFAPQDDYHNYTVDWNKDRLQWIVDGVILRELRYEQALGGQNYPQTPMKAYLGAWAPGDSKNPIGVQQWAQATTDYKQGPWSMSVKSVNIQDASTGALYEYSDNTGSWQSIKVTE
jgi:beta-glucanase (GH16 family)